MGSRWKADGERDENTSDNPAISGCKASIRESIVEPHRPVLTMKSGGCEVGDVMSWLESVRVAAELRKPGH